MAKELNANMGTELKNEWINKKTRNVMFFFLFLGSVLATITKIWIGFDIDEAYAISMPYRLVQGDILFRDMWEVHQMSSFLPAACIWIFVKLTGGVTGIVLFMRLVATFLHLMISLFLYSVVKSYLKIDSIIAMMTALIFYNFLPKWMMTIDFSMEMIWFLTMTILFLVLGTSKKQKRFYIVAGISFAMLILTYPTMLLLFPFLLIGIVKCGFNKKKDVILFIIGNALIAAIFLAYIFYNMSVSEWMSYIPHVFSDGSHQYQLTQKVSLYLTQWKDVLIQSAVIMVPTGIISGVIIFAFKKREMNIPLLIYCVMQILTSGIVLVANVFGIAWGPFRLQVRYLIVGILVCFVWKKMTKEFFWMLFLPSVISFVAVLFASNVGPVSSASYLVLTIISIVILFAKQAEEAKDKKYRYAFLVATSLFLLSLIWCKGYYVRVTEYPPSNILETRSVITKGPAKGVFVYSDDCIRMENDYTMIMEQTTKQDRLLFLGTESINNLSTNAMFVSPTTISTPAFNEQWVTYFTMFPEKMPTVIVIAHNTIDDREKFFEKNPFGIWIAQNYNVKDTLQTESLTLIRK